MARYRTLVDRDRGPPAGARRRRRDRAPRAGTPSLRSRSVHRSWSAGVASRCASGCSTWFRPTPRQPHQHGGRRAVDGSRRPRPLAVVADAGDGRCRATASAGAAPMQGIAGAAVGSCRVGGTARGGRRRRIGRGASGSDPTSSTSGARRSPTAGSELVLVDLRAGNRWPGEFAFLDRLGFTGTAGYMLRRL